MTSLTLRRKLTLALLGLALLALLAAAIGMLAQQRSRASVSNLAQGVMMRSELANNAIDAVNARAVAARNLVLARTDADRRAEMRHVEEAQARLDRTLPALVVAAAAAHADPGGVAMVAAIEQVERRYGPVANAIVGAAASGQSEAAITQMLEQCRPLLAELLGVTGAYLQHNVELTRDRVQAAENDASQAAWVLGGVALMATLASGVLAWRVPRGVHLTLGAEPAELARAADRIRDGDLGPVPGAAQAPAGSVLASMGQMRDQLGHVVAQVRQSSEGVATASSQIAQGNQDLSSRTEHQASALQQTAATMEQLGSQVRLNAENARQADQLAQQASHLAQEGGAVVTQVVQTMQGIESGSRRIGDIVGVIDGIAFQTNILALNAAVEAARAGEQGRGFAVVASEVRSLAQRSADAAREIKALVGDNVSQVARGSQFVEQAGQTMEQLVTAVRNVADIMVEIRNASTEQNTGVGQVGQSVSQLDQTTQQNAALVEESAAAAENLRRQAEQLVQSVAVFRLAA